MQRRRHTQSNGDRRNAAPNRHHPFNNDRIRSGIFAKFDPLNLGLIALVFILINVEFLAYRMLAVDSNRDALESTPANNIESARKFQLNGMKFEPHFEGNPSSTNENDVNSSEKSSLHRKKQHNFDKSSGKNAREPTRRPTISATYNPTTGNRHHRAKYFKRRTYENYDFWKTNTPETIPPLPPDVDPITGEKLPPVVAYVISLTKCDPQHLGYLDGAAILLHSIRRNSYGWVPIHEQMENSTTRNNQSNGDTDKNGSTMPKYGGKGGRYRFKAYVIVDPSASPNGKDSKISGQCSRILQMMGYTLLHRAPLVPLFEIPGSDASNGGVLQKNENKFYDELRGFGYVGKQRHREGPLSRQPGERPDVLRLDMVNDGCCGYAEMLKLHVYGMVEHELAVHLDFDSLVLRPMDDLFDTMLGKQTVGDNHHGENRVNDPVPSDIPRIPIAKGPNTKTPDFSKPIDAAFTRDYNSVKKPSPNAPVGYQGGFLVVRPSLEVLERYRAILRRGEFLLNPRLGWGGKFGGFYGDLTFQGVLPYYYEMVAPEGEHNEIELDRCIYNQMADNPRKSTHKFPKATPLDPEKMGYRDTNVCRDGRDDCSDTDCQRVHPKDSITAHFTFCHKPWDCSDGLPGTVAFETCSGLLREWYGVRRELEEWWLLSSNIPGKTGVKSWWSDPDDQRSFYWKEETISRVHKQREGILNVDQYSGYCDAFGEDGYRSLVHPDAWFEEKENVVKRAIENLHRHRPENVVKRAIENLHRHGPAENNFLQKISLE